MQMSAFEICTKSSFCGIIYIEIGICCIEVESRDKNPPSSRRECVCASSKTVAEENTILPIVRLYCRSTSRVLTMKDPPKKRISKIK